MQFPKPGLQPTNQQTQSTNQTNNQLKTPIAGASISVSTGGAEAAAARAAASNMGAGGHIDPDTVDLAALEAASAQVGVGWRQFNLTRGGWCRMVW